MICGHWMRQLMKHWLAHLNAGSFRWWQCNVRPLPPPPPRYNRNHGWLGTEHQVTYLLTPGSYLLTPGSYLLTPGSYLLAYSWKLLTCLLLGTRSPPLFLLRQLLSVKEVAQNPNTRTFFQTQLKKPNLALGRNGVCACGVSGGGGGGGDMAAV